MGGPGEDLVTIFCDNGKVRISKFLLASLYTILKNIVQSLEKSNEVQLKGLQKEELRLIFHKLFEQVTRQQFESEEKVKDTVVSNQLFKDQLKPEGEIVDNDEAGIDSVLYYITEDHDYQIPDDNPSKEEDELKVIPFSKYNTLKKSKKPGKEGIMVKCDLCDKMLPAGSRGAAPVLNAKHMSTVHGYEMAQCHLCKRKLLKLNLDAHLNKVHRAKAKCPICEKRITKCKLSNHIERHEKRKYIQVPDVLDKNLKYPCPHCGKLQKGQRLQQHIKTRCLENPEIKPETCGICGHISKNRNSHQYHTSFIHGEKKEKEIVQSICNVCGKAVMSHRMKHHMISEHEIRELKYKCQLCEKLFVDSQAVRSHKHVVHKEKSACPHCGIIVSQLKKHIMTVHTQDAEKKYKCQDCGKGFIEIGALKQHQMNMHLKLRPYSCRYGCDISYNDTSNRNSHEKKKHGQLFTTEKEKRLREKIEFLGLDEDLLSAPII